MIIGGGALSGIDFSVFNGGWHWQSAGLSLWESFFCAGTCIGMTVLFRERFNSHGRISKFLSDNAFTVYVFHPPILIACAILLHPLAWPALAKAALLTCLAAAGSFAASALILRKSPLRAIV